MLPNIHAPYLCGPSPNHFDKVQFSTWNSRSLHILHLLKSLTLLLIFLSCIINSPSLSTSFPLVFKHVRASPFGGEKPPKHDIYITYRYCCLFHPAEPNFLSSPSILPHWHTNLSSTLIAMLKPLRGLLMIPMLLNPVAFFNPSLSWPLQYITRLTTCAFFKHKASFRSSWHSLFLLILHMSI